MVRFGVPSCVGSPTPSVAHCVAGTHIDAPGGGAAITATNQETIAAPNRSRTALGGASVMLMISLEDCIALSGLTEEEVLAIAEHEHLPEIAATALAQYLLKQEHGMEKIRDMIVDDIRQAQQRQDKAHILTLLHVLHHFLKSHPEVCPPQHPWSELDFPEWPQVAQSWPRQTDSSPDSELT
jgi:hypothetical protein